jgi:hypothetical protein
MGAFGWPNTGWHYGDTSIAEDVSEVVYQISPEDTPAYNMSGDSKSNAVVHEYQIRSLTLRQRNAAPEGFTFAFTTHQRLPTRRSNVCQIFQKDFSVTRTQQAIAHYAIPDMFADQGKIAFTEMKTDMEHTILQGTLASGATDEVRYMEGFIAGISNATTVTNFAAALTLSEALFNDAIQRSWEMGGAPKDVLVHGKAKRHISGYVGGGSKYFASDEQRVVNTISMYESDFFDVRIHLSRDVPVQAVVSGYSGSSILFIDRTMFDKAWITKPTVEKAPKTADSLDGVTYGEFTLELGQAAAHAEIQRAVIP